MVRRPFGALPVHLRIVFEARRALARVLWKQRLDYPDGLLARRPAHEPETEADSYPAHAHARHRLVQLLRRVDNAKPARALRTREMLGLLGVARDVDLRLASVGRDERRVQLSFFNPVVLALEVHLA